MINQNKLIEEAENSMVFSELEQKPLYPLYFWISWKPQKHLKVATMWTHWWSSSTVYEILELVAGIIDITMSIEQQL